MKSPRYDHTPATPAKPARRLPTQAEMDEITRRIRGGDRALTPEEMAARTDDPNLPHVPGSDKLAGLFRVVRERGLIATLLENSKNEEAESA